jgi:hypothetical protein
MVMAWYMQRIDFVRRKGRGRRAEKSALEPVCLKLKTLCTLYLLNLQVLFVTLYLSKVARFSKLFLNLLSLK